MVEQTLPDNIQIEYSALREEILFRLRVQQDMINYSLLFVGFMATVLAIQGLDPGAVLIVLLFGPLVGIFLALIYLKQHVFVEALAGYISKLGFRGPSDQCNSPKEMRPFTGWEDYLTTNFYTHRLPTVLTGIIGLAEGLFPMLIGIVCWLLYVALRHNLAKSNFASSIATGYGLDVGMILNWLAGLDAVLLVFALVVELYFPLSWM